MIEGVDVASYQGTIDFDLLSQEVRFVVSKATEGNYYRNPTFTRNWSEAKRVGMIRGAYHFAKPDLGLAASTEAAYFLQNIGQPEPDDMLMLDYEVQYNDPVTWCKAWLDAVKAATGIVPFIYLNLATIKAYNWAPVIDAGYPLWLAYYNTPLPATPWPEVTIWQFTSQGVVAGITGRVDRNEWYKEEEMDQDQFNRWFDERLKESGLDGPSVDTLKAHVDKHVHVLDPLQPKQTTVPLHPPVPGALYAGGAADFSQVIWKYPDGSLHTFVGGKEV